MIESVNNIIMLLGKGMATTKLYYSDHPLVNNYGAEIVEQVNNYCAATGREELFIGIIDGFFVFEGGRLFGPAVAGKQLIRFAEALSCGGFGLQGGINLQELQKFLTLATLRSQPKTTIAEAHALFGDHGIKNIRIGDPYSDRGGGVPGNRAKVWAGEAIDLGELPPPTLLYQKLFDVMSRTYSEAAGEHNLDIDETRSVSEFLLRHIQASFADVMQSVHYSDYDSYTVDHSVRVSSLAVYFGTKMNWTKKDLLAVGTAGLLHDIGKSKIPDTILLKKCRLNEEEFAVIRTHAEIGVEILLKQKGVSALDISACWGHHMRHDGGGYPRQLFRPARHPVTALLQICDVFEALTAVRPYKPALDPHGAYCIMLADKGAFHPQLLAAFIGAVGLYPPGTYVRLTDRRVARVTAVGQRIDRPTITIIKSKHGEPLAVTQQYQIDLSCGKQQDVAVAELLLDYREETGGYGVRREELF